MLTEPSKVPPPKFEEWIPLAEQVIKRSLGLRWNDSLEIYSYIATIPLAEALAIEARRAGSDTHTTLMTDDLWFTSMQELPLRWLRAPSQIELAINESMTASVYLGGPRDARRMRNISPEKFDANATGNLRQDEPIRRRKVRHIDLPIGRVCPERAEAYGLEYEAWRRSYNAALATDLVQIQKAGTEWRRKLKDQKSLRIRSKAGTDLTLATKTRETMIEDGIIDASDVRRGFVSTSLPAGKIAWVVQPNSVEGRVRFTDPVFLMGRSVKGLRLTFTKGKLVEWTADENKELLTNLLGDASHPSRLGWFSIGLNSQAETCMLDNSIVKDDVGLGLGPHPQLELSKIGNKQYFEATMGVGRVDVVE